MLAFRGQIAQVFGNAKCSSLLRELKQLLGIDFFQKISGNIDGRSNDRQCQNVVRYMYEGLAPRRNERIEYVLDETGGRS